MNMDNFLTLPDLIKKVDYFSELEKDLASKYFKSNTTRKTLLKYLLTKPVIQNYYHKKFLVSDYYIKINQPQAGKKLFELYYSNYFQLVSPHSVEELAKASSILISFKEAHWKANLPAIALAVIEGYHPLEKTKLWNLLKG